MNLELRIPPLLLVLLLVGAVATLSVQSVEAVTPARAVLAGLLLLVGTGLALAGVVAFRRKGTTVDPRDPGRSAALVTRGIYRYTRNPMYLGFLLWLLAVSLWFASVLGAMLCVAFVGWMNRFQIGPEERILARRFPQEFEAYRQRVRRWCPLPWRLHP